MKTREYEMILDAIQTTGIYVIKEENHEILYYNQKVKEIEPSIRVGMICHEIWADSCSNCPLLSIGDKKTNRTVNYDDPFGKAVDITATRILWEEAVPAFLITVSSHMIEYEELQMRNEAILRSLGDVNFAIYMVDPENGLMDPIRVTEEDREFISDRYQDWDCVVEMLLEKRYHPDYQEKFRETFSREALQRAMLEEKEKEEIIALREINGEYRYIFASARFYKNEKNRNYAVLAFQDADVRIRSELERSRNDQRMAAIVRSRYNTLSTVHLESGICERIYLDNTGRAGETRTGSYEANIEAAAERAVYEEDREAFLSALSLESLRRKADGVEDFEESIYTFRFMGTPVKWVEEHLIFIRQEDGVVVNILARDITRKKKKEQKANREAMEKAHIINSLSSMFFATYYVDLTNDTFRAVKQREEVGQVLGQEMNYTEGIIRYAETFMIPEDQEEYLAAMSYERLKEKLSPVHPVIAFEYRKKENGNEGIRWIRATVVLAEEKRGIPQTALYVAQDITESKEKEERERRILKDACDAANHANASKSEFLSRMSHDIRTPMNAIIGMASIAGWHLDDKERVEDCLQKIAVSGRHLLSLINEVLDMSKIESGKINLAEEKMNLSDLMDDVITIVQPSVKEKNHDLTVHNTGVKHDAVLGDIMRIRQVFTNILSNAVKYTPDGGRLRVEITEKKSRSRGYGCYEFIFSDNGIGMSEEFQKQIFDPFSRAEDSRISRIEGTGLGMTIAQNIVRMMNGTIRVESKVNEGSRFIVTLFLKLQNASLIQAHGDEEPESHRAPLGSFEEKRILLAEDNDLNREIAVEILEMSGLLVETAVNGREAVEMFSNHPEGYYNLIFMDIQMPVMNGYEATQTIRRMKREDAAVIPIVAMTANAFTEDIQASKKAGMNEHITKPLDLRKLKQCMETWL